MGRTTVEVSLSLGQSQLVIPNGAYGVRNLLQTLTRSLCVGQREKMLLGIGELQLTLSAGSVTMIPL